MNRNNHANFLDNDLELDMDEKTKVRNSLLPGISESTMKSTNNHPCNSVSQTTIRPNDKFSITLHAMPNLTDRKSKESKEASDNTICRDSSENTISTSQISELRSQMKTIIEENRINNIKMGKRVDETETKERLMDIKLQMVMDQ